MRRTIARLALAACSALVAVAAVAPTPALAADEGVTMWRLYNRYTGEHLYTAREDEYDALGDDGWDQEGVAWVAPTSGDPVYRLYNQYSGDHHYTTSREEYDALGDVGWDQEGVGWRSAPAATGVPVWRLYNQYASAGTHHYTLDAVERRELLESGWEDEEVGWYALSAGDEDQGAAPDDPDADATPGDPGATTPGGMSTAADFFAYVGTAEGVGNGHGVTALAIIDRDSPAGIDGWLVRGTGTAMDGRDFADFTRIGSATDATAIDNMYAALDVIEECNRLRAYEGLPELMVSDTGMAVAMLNANWTSAYFSLTGILQHASNYGEYYNWAENISAGYETLDGVFEGWFWQEKANYEGRSVTNPDTGETYEPVPGGQTGHYRNIAKEGYVVAGAGVSRNAGLPVYALDLKRRNTVLLPDASGHYLETGVDDELYTVDQYRACLDAAVAAAR